MKQVLFILTVLFAIVSCSNRVTGAGESKMAKVHIEDITTLSFVAKPHGAVMNDLVVVFDGKNGTWTQNNEASALSVKSWDPKKQTVTFYKSALGTPAKSWIKAWITCYEGDKIYVDFVGHEPLSGTYSINKDK